jgi:DNA-binding transcriptional LysR family regulator
MEDHKLKAFCLVVEMRSFSRAAEEKFMTQSAMSHLIRNLEDELGVTLLHRHSKTVTPTPAGRRFYVYAREILKLYERMENDVYSLVHKMKGPLHLGASPTAATYLLPQVFYAFFKQYPEIHVQLSVSNTERIIHDLENGRIAAGIVEGTVKNETVFMQEIAQDEIVIIASEDNPLTMKKHLTIQDLWSQPFIMPELGSGTRESIDDFLRSAGRDPTDMKIVMTLGSPELIVHMVQTGMGVSFVSKWSVFKAIKDGSVKLLAIEGKKLKRKFYLISVQEEPSTLAARTFSEFIRGYTFFVPF